MARWITYGLVLGIAFATLPASAQFVIKAPTFTLPEPTPIITEEEAEAEAEAAEPSVPTYEGPNIALTTSCEVERLEYAGIRCSAEQPCQFFLELVAVASENDWVVLAGEVHTADATYESIVLSSSDGGDTWTESAERIVAGGIGAVSIVDGEHAFVAGQQGDTATGEFPVLLSTDDTAAGWDLWKVAPGGNPARGLVVEFRADSPRHGYLILESLASTGDPFQLLETYNAGRSWSMRQISAEQPRIPGPRRTLAIADWRLRPDSGAGQYVLAHSSSTDPSGWAEKARFNYSLGTCP